MTLIEQIRKAYDLEQADLTPAQSAKDLPSSYELITPHWLTDVLAGQTPGAQVESYSLDVRDDGSYNRRRIFIEWNEAGQIAGLPESVFCKAAHSLQNRLMFGNSGSIATEVNFYRSIRPELDIQSPRAYFATYDPVSFNSMLMLEDLGPDVHFCQLHTEITREQIEGQLQILAYLHGRFCDPRHFATLQPLVLTFHEKVARLNAFKFEQVCHNGFVAAESVIPKRLFGRIDAVWPATMEAVERGHRRPHTINHADVHLANWYILPDNRMGLTDWSAVCTNHWARDVSYMMGTALGVDHRRAWEGDLLAYYLDQLQGAGGPAVPFDEGWTLYREQFGPALAYWTSALAPTSDMPDFQPKNLTLEWIRRLAVAMDDLESLNLF